MALRVTRVKTFIVDGGFRPWTFVKIETSDDGLVGWGDCTDWGSPGPVAAMVERLAELVVGQDPMQAERIWWELHAASVRHTGGIAWKAMAGIDSALWDIRGKVLGAPVWQLLGGKLRDEFRLYWSHCGSARAIAWRAPGRAEGRDDRRSSRAGRRGPRAGLHGAQDEPVPAQGPPGRLPRSAANTGWRRATSTGRRCATPRPSSGRSARNWGQTSGSRWTWRSASSWPARSSWRGRMEPFDLMWLEVESFDPTALRTIRESTRTTICTGESIFGTQGFKPYLDLRAQDIIMPDLAWNGITMGKKIADLAHTYDVLLSFHNCHSPITTLVSANVAATVPNFFILEIDVGRCALARRSDDPPVHHREWPPEAARSAGPRFGPDRVGTLEAPSGGVPRRPVDAMSGQHVAPPLPQAGGGAGGRGDQGAAWQGGERRTYSSSESRARVAGSTYPWALFPRPRPPRGRSKR